MFSLKYTAVQYTRKDKVLHFLAVLMHRALLPEERRLILLRCGVGVEAPMNFSELAHRFKLGTSADAASRYAGALQKTRAAIPGSELAFWVANYNRGSDDGEE